ncbi:MAG: hypothetical protein AABZ12_06215 [Planctomycetota bacterium]
MQRTGFLETQTILKALEFAAAKGAFAGNPRMKKTALTLIKGMKSNASLSGRHQQLQALLKKGATIQDMMRSTSSSRRTVFRYLNHFEEAGVGLALEDGVYRLS